VNPALRTLFIHQLSAGIQVIGPQFEAFARIIVDDISPVSVVHAGLNPLGHPVGHVVDTLASNGTVAAEYTTDEKSFRQPFNKLKGDCEHVRTTQPDVKTIYLVSSRECGPKARNHLTRLANVLWRKKQITVEIYDCIRLAAYIVDHLLLKDQIADRLEPYLGALALIRTQYAASNLVPLQKAGYRPRPEILAVIESRLAAEKVVVICGIGGSGKSDLAAEFGRAAKTRYTCVLWCLASSLRSPTELAAVHVQRRGKSANFQSMVQAGQCLLILDDLSPEFAKEDLLPLCGPGSAIIVTRQVGATTDFKIPLLDQKGAMELLQSGPVPPCPREIADTIWSTVGGHPLALRLLNSSARAASWRDVASDCADIGAIPDEDRARRLADRLLNRISGPLASYIALFQWCGASRIDRSWTRFCLNGMAPARLEEYCLLAADRLDVLRLHDIFASVVLVNQCAAELARSFESKVTQYIERLAVSSGEEDLAFHNFCDVHRQLLLRLVGSSPNPRPFLYCLLQTDSADDLPLHLIGDPEKQVDDLVRQPAIASIDVYESIEAIEVIYRRTKRSNDDEAAKTYLKSSLPLFDKLATASGFPTEALPRLRHHQAKALRNVGDFDAALSVCREVMNCPEPPPAARLLFGRLLAKVPEERSTAAQQFLRILSDAQSKPSQNEMTVVLSAFTELNYVTRDFPSTWREFGAFVVSTALDAAERGIDLAYETIAGFATKLQQHDPETLCRLFSRLPPRPEVSELTKSEAESWGRILLTVGIAEKSPERKRDMLEDAVQCFRSISAPSTFIKKEISRALNHLGRYAAAKAQLATITSEDWGAYEYLEYALALSGLGDPNAVKAIQTAETTFETQCASAPRNESFRSMFVDAAKEIRMKFKES